MRIGHAVSILCTLGPTTQNVPGSRIAEMGRVAMPNRQNIWRRDLLSFIRNFDNNNVPVLSLP